MVPHSPFKYKCPKCNGEKIIVPKSDVIDYHPFCLKCNSTMIRHELNFIDKILLKFRNKYIPRF